MKQPRLDRDPGVPRERLRTVLQRRELGQEQPLLGLGEHVGRHQRQHEGEREHREIGEAQPVRHDHAVALEDGEEQEGIEQDRHAEAEGMGGDAAIEAEPVALGREGMGHAEPQRILQERGEERDPVVAEDQEERVDRQDHRDLGAELDPDERPEVERPLHARHVHVGEALQERHDRHQLEGPDDVRDPHDPGHEVRRGE